jgi:DnaK suppressor protein
LTGAEAGWAAAVSDAERMLADERRRLEQQVEALTRDLQAIVDASAGANADDEHDPEGSTIGFERAQVASLLDHAHGRLAAVERAAERLRTGAYGRCEGCGAPIAAERLVAHPTASTCASCPPADRPAGPLRRRG